MRGRQWFDSLSRAWLSRLAGLACALAVVLMVAHNHYNVRTTRDIGADDEGWYVAGGVLLGKPGFPNGPNGWPIPELGPLHCLSYWGLSKLDWIAIAGPLELYYAAWELRTALLALAILFVVRRASPSTRGPTPWWQALLASFYFVNCAISEVWPFPMHTATLVIVGGVLAATWMRTTVAALGMVTVSLALAGFCRPELLFAYVPGLAVFSVVLVQHARKDGSWRRAVVWIGTSLAPPIAGVALIGNPLGGTRSWFAFAQHYTLGLFESKHIQLDPWANWGPTVERDFPGASSVFGAIRTNPAAVLAHIVRNLWRFPRNALQTTVLTLEASKHVERALWLGMLVLALVQARRIVRHRKQRTSDVASAVAPGWTALVFAFWCCFVPFVLATLIVHPRLHYFVPVIILGTVIVFTYPLPLPEWKIAPPARAALLLAGCVLAPVLTATKSSAASIAEWITREPKKHELEGHRQRVSTYLRDRHLEGTRVVLEYAWGTCFYAGYDCKNYLRWDKTQPFDTFIEQRGIDLVVIDDEMLHDVRFIDDPEVAGFLEHPERLGFRLDHVPRTDVIVAVRAAR